MKEGYHLTKRYGAKVALKDFSYTFTPGIYGILGTNGAGKSTLMNLITDNVRRDGGEILFNGHEILKLGKEFRQAVGYMPQQQGMYDDFSARAFLRYMAADRIVFLTTHIVSDIESIARDVLLMKEGSIVAHGRPEDLVAQVRGSSLEDVYMAYLGED